MSKSGDIAIPTTVTGRVSLQGGFPLIHATWSDRVRFDLTIIAQARTRSLFGQSAALPTEPIGSYRYSEHYCIAISQFSLS
ncbi:hypothetical protein RRG08_059266 [Elysia crispata]|uniref:Uncharacterized protein n=1 Tax=Elysia crispata TaxID=231223 RepID=A0AAE0Y935_9GAST|nr:hypothetical protein RRG08_059266 [Elysia crispata]